MIEIEIQDLLESDWSFYEGDFSGVDLDSARISCIRELQEAYKVEFFTETCRNAASLILQIREIRAALAA